MTQTFIRNAAGKALADSPALNSLSRQVLVPASRPNLPRAAVVVSGPGPQEPSQSNGTNGSLIATDDSPRPTKNGSTGELVARSASQESPSNEDDDGDDDEGPVAPRPAADPYAGLDSAFGGGYVADEPRPQNQDLLDLI